MMTGHMIPHGYLKTSQRSTKNTCNIIKITLSINSKMRSQFLTKRTTKGEISVLVTRTCRSRRRSLRVLWHHLLRPKMHKVNNSQNQLYSNPRKFKRRQLTSSILMLLQPLNKRTKMILMIFSQLHPTTTQIKMMGSTTSNPRSLLWADKTSNNKLIICLDTSRR